MTDKLYIDIETASDLNLKKVGAYRYAKHPSTFIRCMAWAINDDLVRVWSDGEWMPPDLIEALKYAEVHAHNAQFERLMFEYNWAGGAPEPTWSQWRCTAAQARYNGLPGALDKCAKLLDLEVHKADPTVMRRCSDASYRPNADELHVLRDYCARDVEVERLIEQRLPEMPDDELVTYQVNERINDRGFRIDREFAETMESICHAAADRLNARLNQLTGGWVTKFTQVQRIKEYLSDYLGRQITDLSKAAIEDMLENWSMGSVAREVLEIRLAGAKSSVAKYTSALEVADDVDDRVRGAFVYAGAGATGRFSAVRFQPHNLIRNVPDNVRERMIDIQALTFKQFELVHGPIMQNASYMLRPTIVAAPGKTFVIADYSSVEARGLPWLAGNTAEVQKWANGADLYIEDASAVYNTPPGDVTPEMRQVGKVVRLACGFGGKGGALMAMARSYGLTWIDETLASTFAEAWHEANPWVNGYGYALQRAAIEAMFMPGQIVGCEVGQRVAFCANIGPDDKTTLRCQLPSGRLISYRDARLDEGPYGYEISAIKPREQLRVTLWHGLYSENVDQAVCNDLLRHAMIALHYAGYEVVLHVHDEVAVEVDQSTANVDKIHIQNHLETRPDWAPDFPLEAKPVISKRYTK